MDEGIKKQLLIFDQAETLLKNRESLYLKIYENTKSCPNKNNTHALQELRALDHLLDEVENFDQLAIILSLLEHPLFKDNSLALKFKNSLLEGEEEIQTLSNASNFLLPLDKKLLEIKALILKKRNLRALIFSRHPKVLIAYEWHAISQMLDEMIKKMQNGFFIFQYKDECLENLNCLKQEIEKRWNPKLYQTTTVPIIDKIQNNYRNYKSFLSILQKKQKERIFETKEWIESTL